MSSDDEISETVSVYVEDDPNYFVYPDMKQKNQIKGSRFFSVWSANSEDTVTHPSTPKRNNQHSDARVGHGSDTRAQERDEEAKSRLDLDVFLSEYTHYLQYLSYNAEEQQKLQYDSLIKLAPMHVGTLELHQKMLQIEERLNIKPPQMQSEAQQPYSVPNSQAPGNCTQQQSTLNVQQTDDSEWNIKSKLQGETILDSEEQTTGFYYDNKILNNNNDDYSDFLLFE